MPSFPKPKFTFQYSIDHEITALRKYRDTKPGRNIPTKKNNKLLINSWNIANLGLQKRRSIDYRLIAELISWFDITALQEVNDNLEGLMNIRKYLPENYKALFSDRAGNNERMAFLYDSKKVSILEKVGEIAIPVKDHKHIKLPNVKQSFRGYDRNPFLASFQAGNFKFVLVNVHLYFGKDKKTDRDRRSLEAYAVSRWVDLRSKDKDAYANDIIALGDFNLPKVEPGDPIYSALRRRGLERPPHSTRIASNIANDKDYDQILFLPAKTKEFTKKIGVFDFDGAIFSKLWQQKTPAQFRSYVKYYISDHRPLWAEFNI